MDPDFGTPPSNVINASEWADGVVRFQQNGDI